jgi:sugar lactone lactonase YvrE
LQNIGNQNLGAVSPGLVVSGPNFIQVPGSGPSADCTATFLLAPGVACDLGVSFTPQAPGSLISSAVFTDNALNATSASQSVPLSGGALESTEPLNLMGAGTGSGSVSSSPFGISCSLNAGVALPAPPGSCSASYPGGTVVSLEEIPSAGSTFTGWGGACASQGSSQFCNLNTNVGAATNISASFSPVITYTLTVMPAGTGSGTVTDNLAEISCTQTNGVQTGTCSGSYSSSVTLTANATGTSTFVGWGGACASQGASATCTVNVNSVLSVSASFVAPGASQAGTLKPITAGTVYGQGGSFTSANGNNGGVSANSLNQPDGLAVDSGGNLYAADLQNSRVLFYPAGSSTATRIYGQGGSFTSGTQNNGGVSANSLNNPYGLAVDSVGDLYIADENNNRVLFYPAGSTTATRVYGQNGSFTSNAANNGGVSANSLNGPQSVALDSSGNLYVADTLNSRVLFYPAGSTTATQVYGQGGSFSSGTVNNGGISANSLNTPFALTLDSSGDLYVADDKNNRVLFYPYNSTTATRVYGQGGSFATNTANNGGVSANSLNGPQSVAVDSGGNLYVADYFNSRVLSYPFGSTTATRVYGQSNSFTSTSSNTNANSLSNPAALALGSSGNLYVADKSNNRLLEYGSFGNVNVCPSGQTTPAPCNNIVTLSYSSTTTTTFGTTPQVLTQGAPNLDFTLGSGSTCVGTYSGGSSCTVNVNFAPLAPGLRIGAVNLLNIGNNLVASQLLSGVGQGPAAAFSPGAPTTVNTGSFSLLTPAGAAVDAAGDVFIADNGNHRVIKVAANSTVTTVGTGLNYPQGLAVDGAGDLFIADNNLNQVVEVTPAGTQTTIGTGLYAQLGVTVDTAGDVFIADFYTSGPNIQTLSGQVVEVPVGCATSSCQSVVYAPESGMHPIGLAMDAAGDLFIADFSDNPGTTPGKVVEIPAGCTSAGCQTTVGTGWYEPEAVAVDAAGDVFVADEAPKVVEVPVGCANNNNNCQIVVSGILAYGVAVDGKGNVFLPDLHNTPLTDPYSNLVLEINRSLAAFVELCQHERGQHQL